MKENVAILGASDKEDRYSFKAFKMLKEYGHTPFPVHPSLEKIDQEYVYKKLKDIPEKIDTLTMYVGSQISDKMIDEILALKPRRVIFNPGSENLNLKKILEEKDIQVIDACTLVLLRTNQF